MVENPLVDLSGLTKPVTVLIEKVADAIGVCYEPTRIVKKADAEAKASLIQAKANIDISDLQQRALQRFTYEQMNQQLNIESVMNKAIPLLEESAKPEDVERDWITNTFDKCKNVSDEDMQQWWAKILAGEVRAYPVSF
jgi:hypothetical protein